MVREKGNWGIYLVLIVLISAVIIPIAYMFVIALTPRRLLFQTILFKPTLENFIYVLTKMEFQYYILNSWVIGLSTTGLTLVLASLAGYGLSRMGFKSKGRNLFIVGILLTQMLPMEVLIISYFSIIRKLNLYNTRLALILLDGTITVPFCTLMLKSVFDSIPREIEEAAMIDGCSTLSSFLRVIVPLSRGGLFATAVFAFLQVWSEYLYALTFTTSYQVMPVTVGLAQQLGHYTASWNIMMSLASVAGIPVLVLFALTQRTFIKGLTAGGVKG